MLAAGYESAEEWIEAGREIVGRRSSAAWALADWVAGGAMRFGGSSAREAAGKLGISPGKFSDYLTVAKAYPKFRRRNTLGFSHHAETARLPEADRERILDLAEAEGWTRDRVREAAREVQRKARPRRRPDPDEGRDMATRFRDRLDAERRIAAGGIKRMTRIATEILRSDEIETLHGNARRGLARNLRRAFDTAGERMRVHRAEAAVALARIEGSKEDSHACVVAALVDEFEPILRLVAERIRAASWSTSTEARDALAARIEAAINARMGVMGQLFADVVEPELRRLAGDT